jgi:O-antigen/teichoic acid export membrane protein
VLKAGLRKTRELASGQIARASMMSVAITITGLGLGFGQAVLSARLLGATGYGRVLVPMAIVQIVGLLGLSGYAGLAVREIPARIATGDAGGLTAFVRHAFLMVVGLSAAATVVLVIVAVDTNLVGPEYRETLEIGALIVVPFALIGLLRGLAQGFGRVAQAQAPGELARPAVMLVPLATVALLGLSFGPLDYMWLSLLTAVVAMLVAAGWLWKSDWSRLREPPASTGARHFAAAVPFLGLGLVETLQGQINTLLLGSIASPHEAGLFQPVVRLTPVIMLPVMAAGMRFGPRIAELWQNQEMDRIRWTTRTFTWTTSVLTLGIAVTLAGAGPRVMEIFGPDFPESAPLLWYIAGAQVFNAACGPVTMLLAMSGRSGRALWGQIAGLTANVLIGAALIPAYGTRGAAIAMASGIVVVNVILLAMAKAHHGFDPSIRGILVPFGMKR